MAAVGDSPSSYEEARKQRLEENKKRMEELGLMKLSNSLKQTTTSPRKPLKRRLPSLEELGLEARRSSRVAGKPVVSYRDQVEHIPGMRARCGTRERHGLARRYFSEKARMAAIDAAEEVFKDLQHPAFVKPMLHSHTASGFWLGLPAVFCKHHLPHRDDRIMLEDEKDVEWECIYLSNKVGLSGGWRGFSLDHDLVDGDCCIFELVSSHRFKVHIFRAHESEDGEEGDVEEVAEGANEKEGGKNATKKKPPATGAAKTNKAKKLTATASRKLKLEDGKVNKEEEGANPEPFKKASKKVKKDSESEGKGTARSTRRRQVKEEDDEGEVSPSNSEQKENKENGKEDGSSAEDDDIIELESGDEDDDEEDVWSPAALKRFNQASAGCRSSGRATRNSTARSLPPRSLPPLVKAGR